MFWTIKNGRPGDPTERPDPGDLTRDGPLFGQVYQIFSLDREGLHSKGLN